MTRHTIDDLYTSIKGAVEWRVASDTVHTYLDGVNQRVFVVCDDNFCTGDILEDIITAAKAHRCRRWCMYDSSILKDTPWESSRAEAVFTFFSPLS